MKSPRNTSVMLACTLFGFAFLQGVALMPAKAKGSEELYHSDQTPVEHRRWPFATASKMARKKAPYPQMLTTAKTASETLDAKSSATPISGVPLPSCLHCILITCCQFAIIYTALAVCRTYHEFTGTGKGQVEAALRAAAQTLTCGPMICALFIACRLQAVHLAGSKSHEEPRFGVQGCMYLLTLSVHLSTVLVLLIRLVADKPFQLKSNAFDIERPFISSVGEAYCGWDELGDGAGKTDKYRIAFYGLTVTRYLVLSALYVGLGGVIYAYLPSYLDAAPPEIPAMAITCTIILTIAFFSMQMVIAVSSSISEFARLDFPQVVGMMHAASAIVDFAPTLAVLFLTAHMRALQHGAELDEWAENCMAASTGAMCTTALLAILVPWQMGASLTRQKCTHEIVLERPKDMLGLGYIFIVMQYACMVCFYGGAIGVVESVYTFQSPGPMQTSPVSASEQCIMNLTCQFLLVYFLVSLMVTASQMIGWTSPIEKWGLYPAIDSMRMTVAFAPLLSMLCLATRMHMLLASGKTGAPADHVHDAVCFATWALQLSCLCCLATDPLMAKTKVVLDGKVVNSFRNWYLGVFAIAVRFIALLIMYRGVALVVVEFLFATPQDRSMPRSHSEIKWSGSSHHVTSMVGHSHHVTAMVF